jgi:hypothetical protein
MKRLLALILVAAAFALPAARLAPAAELPPAKTCRAGYVHARLPWGEKCLHAGEYCRIKGDRYYHRYGFHCHTGRLSRSAAGKRRSGSGCEPGYSPCLPRVADLNCSDIPDSKKPVRVTGNDPYGLDRDGDGWGCEP